MAFDQNLEADRIDGFNFFSAFVRVPLLVLGGILGGDDVTKDIDSDILGNHGMRRREGSNNSITSLENNENDPSVAKQNTLTNQKTQRQRSSSISIPKNCAFPDLESETDHGSATIKRTKKMSWSDESGLPLVYENDESLPHQDHRISPYTAATGGYQKPTKSAMRKSRSIRHVSNELSDQDKTTSSGTQSRFIPNMNPRSAGNGLIIPTRPYGNKMMGSSGTESPQWGWYINTTPPTPELYYTNRSPKKHLAKVDHYTKSETQNLNKPSSGNTNTVPKSRQNQVFQNLQNSTKTNPVGGWTSIPI